MLFGSQGLGAATTTLLHGKPDQSSGLGYTTRNTAQKLSSGPYRQGGAPSNLGAPSCRARNSG